MAIPPGRLYHYTSIFGVEGVLQNRAVWASILHFLNDSKEWLYALDLVRHKLEGSLTSHQDLNWITFIAELTRALDRISSLNICAFSLTPNGNQLSQWRAYCPPEGGYNLEFDGESLHANITRHGFQLNSCIYNTDEQRNAISTIVEKGLPDPNSVRDEASVKAAVEDSLIALSRRLANVAPLLKHPDFKEEQEWRAFALVPFNDPRMSYHVKGSIAVPHCTLQLEKENGVFPILGVTVGPNANQALAIRGVHSIIQQSGEKIWATTSTTPLRKL